MACTTVVITEDGELTQYDFPGAAQTFIYGMSDETGALSGNIVDETGGHPRLFRRSDNYLSRGAVTTYGDFVNAAGCCRRQLCGC